MSIAFTPPLVAARDLSGQETANEYSDVLYRRGGFRVAVCRGRRQWLLQKRRGRIKPGGTAWDTLGYCVTRNALMRLSRLHTGKPWPELSALPDRFKRGEGA